MQAVVEVNMQQQELTLEKALQIVQQALDTITTNGPERRLIDRAYLVLVTETQKNKLKES